MMIDAYVPAAARERFRVAAEAAAPGARILMPATRDEAVAQAPEADIATGWSLPAGVLEHGRRLQWVHAFTAGVDGFVALPGIRDRRVVLTRTVGAHVALPDHVMALVLAFARRLPLDIRNQANRVWDRPARGGHGARHPRAGADRETAGRARGGVRDARDRHQADAGAGAASRSR